MKILFTLRYVWILLLAAGAVAQSDPAVSESSKPASTMQSPSGEESRRIFKIFPAYGVVQDPNARFRPLTKQDKFVLFVHGAADPYNLLVAGTVAGIEQAANIFAGYGQGGEGYAKRFGASMADQATNSFFKNFAFPVLLRQDPRYFRRGNGSIKHRLGYAISRVFVTRNDSGANTFNSSGVLGSLASSAVANSYYPASDRGAGATFGRVGIAFGTDAALNVVGEFGADLKRRFIPKRHNKIRR